MRSTRFALLLAAVLFLPAHSRGQNFNIDIGDQNGDPPPGYGAAAGQPGVWNVLKSSAGIDLVDLQGNPTGASINVCCSMGAFTGGGTGAITGPDAEMWNDSKLSDGFGATDYYMLSGVQDGIYEIYAYARDLLDPSAVQEIAGMNAYTGVATCSGPWPGMQIEGVTFVKQRVAAVNNSVGVFFPQISASFGYLAGLQVVRLSNAGINYCTSTANSLGVPAVMSSEGGPSTYFVSKPFTLIASPVPTGNAGIFFYGSGTTQVPLGNGFLCVSGGSIPLARLPASVAQANVLRHDMDFTAPPFAAAKILPGSTWNFQAWYRDPQAGGAGTNLSDAMTVHFIP